MEKDYYKNYRLKNQKQILEVNLEYRKKHRQEICDQKKKYFQSLTLFNSVPANDLSSYDTCRQDPNNSDLLQVKCTYCNKWFNPTNRQVVSRLRAIRGSYAGEARIYCSDGCKMACPTYRQRIFPKGFKNNTSREVPASLRKLVLERDNWTCTKCNKNKQDSPDIELHCHHIDPISNNPVESGDIDNCITVCKECHIKIHSKPGCEFKSLKCKK